MKAVARRSWPALRTAVVALAGVSAVGLLGWAGWRWALTSGRFAMTEVVYRGMERAGEPELRRLGGATVGANLIAVDTRAVERALAAHPWVKSVRVTRRLPSRLAIDIVEHRAAALVTLGDLYLVNDDGEPFKRVQAGEAIDLPLITGLERDQLVDHREKSMAKLAAAVAALEAYQRSGAALGHALSEVRLEPDGMTLTTVRGEQVRFGDAVTTDKLARLERVRSELNQQGVEAAVIRLDDRTRPGRVTVQPLGNGRRPGSGGRSGDESGERREVPSGHRGPSQGIGYRLGFAGPWGAEGPSRV